MTGTELHFATLAETGALIRDRKLSPVEYVQTLMARIEAVNPLIDAFLLPTPDVALSQAKKAEAEIMAGNWRGPMHGIPFALKGLFNIGVIRLTVRLRISLFAHPRLGHFAIDENNTQ